MTCWKIGVFVVCNWRRRWGIKSLCALFSAPVDVIKCKLSQRNLRYCCTPSLNSSREVILNLCLIDSMKARWILLLLLHIINNRRGYRCYFLVNSTMEKTHNSFVIKLVRNNAKRRKLRVLVPWMCSCVIDSVGYQNSATCCNSVLCFAIEKCWVKSNSLLSCILIVAWYHSSF